MKYDILYEKLINRAKNRDTLIGYTEKHHIIPKCLGGSDDSDNIVILTAEEHFLAHQLLVKIYPNSNALIYAAYGMTAGANGNRIGNKKYGWLRRKFAKANLGNNWGRLNKGKPKSKQHRENLRKAKLGSTMSEEARNKISKAHKGKKRSEEARRNMSIAQNKPEVLAVQKQKNGGINNAFYGKKHTEAAIIKMRQKTLARKEKMIATYKEFCKQRDKWVQETGYVGNRALITKQMIGEIKK